MTLIFEEPPSAEGLPFTFYLKQHDRKCHLRWLYNVGTEMPRKILTAFNAVMAVSGLELSTGKKSLWVSGTTVKEVYRMFYIREP